MPDSTSGNSSPSRVELQKKLVETSKGAVQLAIVALKVAASAVQNVPYLGAISTVLEAVMKISDEVDVCKATWKAVMSEIQAIQMLVANFRMQCTRKGLAQDKLPETIKKAFQDFEVSLLKVIVTMDDCKTSSKGIAHRIRLMSKRSEITATAKQCEKEVTSALRMFQATLQMDQWNLQIDQGKLIDKLTNAVMPHAPLIATLNSTIPTSILPPAPSIFYGRSGEVHAVVHHILSHGPVHVAIVGSGGIGKTSIALTAIHHPDVEKEFLHQRFFLSCEAIFTADTLVLELLKLFGVSFDSSSSRLPSTLVLYLQAMSSKCLLCLDNFETPWDSDKDQVESLLASIAVQNLALVITSRDSDRPRGVKWGALKPIQPLTVDAACETWDAISHSHDQFSLLLIKAVDCIPLAVTLLAQLAEVESSEALWASWNSEWTRLVKTDGSAHRLNNLELSIELSLQGPRLRECSGALDFFMILCMLPQGLPESRVPDVEIAFGKDFTGLRSAIRVLKQCSLIYTVDGFLRVLSPIRQYTQSHPDLSTPLTKTLFTRITNHYLNLIPVDDDSHIESHAASEAIQLEFGNISAVLDLCLARDMDLDQVLHQIVQFSRACRYLAIYEARLPSRAASIAHDCNHGLEGDCYFEEGMIYHHLNNLSGAENMFKAALALHKEVGDSLGQANDLRALGALYHRLGRLEDAKQCLQPALNLYIDVTSQSGQADTLVGLGKLYNRLDLLEDAEQALQSALKLYTDINSRLGRGNALRALGQLYNRLDRLEDADRALQSAYDLHRAMNIKMSQADDLQALGGLYQRLDRLGDAETALQAALNLYTEINHGYGQANDLKELGRLYQRLDRHEEAEQCLQSALKLYSKVNSQIGCSDALHALGELYMKLDKLEDAEQALQSALNIYTVIDGTLGQGYTLQQLGKLCTIQSRFSEAEDFLTRAMDAHRRAHELKGQQYTQELLRHLHNEQANIVKEDADEQGN